MHIYANNFLVAENQPEQLKGLIAEISKKAGIRVIIRPDYISFAPPVSKFVVELSSSSSLKSLSDSLKERLTISGFTTEPITKEQRAIYGRKLKEIRVSIREGKPGIFWRGGWGEKRKARLLQRLFDLKEHIFEVSPLKGSVKKQLIIQGDKETLMESVDVILEWFLSLAKTDAEIPPVPSNNPTTTVTQPQQAGQGQPQQKPLPDPLKLLDPSSFGDPKGSQRKTAKSTIAIDPELADLPLGDNIVDFLSSDDPKAKKLQEQIKHFYESTGKTKPSIPKEDPFSKAKMDEFLKKSPKM